MNKALVKKIYHSANVIVITIIGLGGLLYSMKDSIAEFNANYNKKEGSYVVKIKGKV